MDQSLSIGHACSKAECVGCIEKQDFVDRLLEVRETELYRVQAELGEYGIKSKINDGSIGADEASATEERADAVDAKAQKGKKAEKAKAEAQKEEKRLNAKLKKKVVRACYRARVRPDTYECSFRRVWGSATWTRRCSRKWRSSETRSCRARRRPPAPLAERPRHAARILLRTAWHAPSLHGLYCAVVREGVLSASARACVII